MFSRAFWIACALSCAATGDSLAQAVTITAFTNVTVIDGTSPQPRSDRTVVIRGNRIVAEGPSASIAVPSGARVIDGRGKFLIPGLWDMHVHLAMPGGREVLPLYIANGVTGVRDMAGDWPTLTAWRRDIARGSVIGPRIIASGPYLEGGDVPIPHLLVKSPADAAPAVDSLIRLGVDFIKVHGQLTRESYFAIARAARARRIPFAGHVSRVVGAADASDSGQASIEHLLAIPNACTDAEVVSLAPRFTVQAALGRCSTEDLSPLFAKLRRNGTRVVPTLTAQLEVARWPKRDLPGDSVQRYIPDSMRKYVAGIFPMVDSVPPDADVVGLKLFEKRVAITGALHRAGVIVMAGTDAPAAKQPAGIRAARGASAFHPRRSFSIRGAEGGHARTGQVPGNARLARHDRDRQGRRSRAAQRESAGRHPEFEPNSLRRLEWAAVHGTTRRAGTIDRRAKLKLRWEMGDLR